MEAKGLDTKGEVTKKILFMTSEYICTSMLTGQVNIYNILIKKLKVKKES